MDIWHNIHLSCSCYSQDKKCFGFGLFGFGWVFFNYYFELDFVGNLQEKADLLKSHRTMVNSYFKPLLTHIPKYVETILSWHEYLCAQSINGIRALRFVISLKLMLLNREINKPKKISFVCCFNLQALQSFWS